MRYFFLGILFAGLATPAQAAISVTYDSSASSLTGALIGSGITVVGTPTLTGSNVSTGTFTGGGSSIGINSGVLLTTGDAKNAEGPNTSESATGTASGAGDGTLNSAFGGGTTDTSALEFDFSTAGGNVFFNYVFASEEYNEYSGSQFNDVFGFFLDGVNIALIPSTLTQVSINTVNAFTNSAYYNNNDLAFAGPSLLQLGYDGFTDVFTASALGLTAGTHHIKLAISDRSDQLYDSGVFLQANTFSDVVTPTVPEPASLIVWSLLGLTITGGSWWRRRKATA